MAHKITSADITNKNVRFFVDQPDATYLDEADRYHAELLQKNAVDPSEAADPVTSQVRRVLVLYVCVLVCRDHVSITHREAAEGVQEDPWEKLYKMYQQELQQALGSVSAETLTGATGMDLDGPVGKRYAGGDLF